MANDGMELCQSLSEKTIVICHKMIKAMQRDGSSLDTAQQVISKLLCPSWVCEVGLRNEWPEIRFDHKSDQYEACLWIDGDWRIEPAPELPQGLSERQKQMVWLGELVNQEVKNATCKPDGGLEVEFISDLRLLIPGIPSDSNVYEPWILSEPGHDDGAKVVALRLTGFSTWPGRWMKDSPMGDSQAASRADS